jgi:hypothetical protein
MKCIRKNVNIGIGDQRLKGEKHSLTPPGGHVLSVTDQTAIDLKLDGVALRTGLRAAAAAASASCFAARRTALLFVLGRIFGAAMLLGRGLGLAVISSDRLEVTAEGLALALAGRIAATEAGRLTAYREGVAATDAWDAGRWMGTLGGLEESFEFVREGAGVLGTTGARTEQTDCLDMRMAVQRTLTHERSRRTLFLRNT